MKIKVTTTPNTTPVSFEYQQKMVGVIHKWLGINEIHDNMSLYSFSWLGGSKLQKGHLNFPCGACFMISFYDKNEIKKIITSIQESPEMFCGMIVNDIQFLEDPDMSEKEKFYCTSPIFIKRKLENGKFKHFTYNDNEVNAYMKETLLRKMHEAGLEEDETLDISFDTSYVNKKIKLSKYHGIENKANVCPVIIKAKPSTKLFAWNVGLGNCTGIGFGSIN